MEFNMQWSISGEYLYVQTDYNKYQICPDPIKGIGIYQEIPSSPNILIKSYRHNKISTAIQYLIKKELFVKQ